MWVVSVMLLVRKEMLLPEEWVIAAGWSSLLLVAAVVGFCYRCPAAKG